MVKRTEKKKTKVIKAYREGESMETISKKVNVCACTIGRWLDRWGIEKRDLSKQIHLSRQNDFSFTDKQIQIIEGELLGDGCLREYINRPHSDFRFDLVSEIKNHCLLVKKKMPNSLFSKNAPWSDENIWELKSRSHPLLTKLQKKWYEETKIVPKDIELTDTVLYFWYIGDGGLTSRQNISRNGVPYVRFATDGFSESDVNLLSEKLKGRGFENNLQKCSNLENGSGLRIALTADSTRRFVDDINNPISEYDYKWNLTDMEI